MTTTLMTTTKDSFDRFGDDLCQLLLSDLPIDDKFRLESVSKQWQSLILTGQTSLLFDSKQVKRLKQNLQINKTNEKLFEFIIQKCPNISTVIIECNKQFLNNYLDLLIKYCHRLRHFCFKVNYNYFPLQFTDWKSIDCFMQTFGQQLLTFKCHKHISRFSRQLLYRVCNLLPNLKTLDISDKFYNQINLDDISTVNTSHLMLPKTIQSIGLLIPRNVSNFEKFANNYGQQLRSLDLNLVKTSSSISVYNSNLSTINCLTQITQLRQLKIKINKTSNQLAIDLLAQFGRQCRKLWSLDFKSNYSIQSDCIEIIDTINDKMSPKLRRLSLNFRINTFTIEFHGQWFLKCLKQLTHLSIRIQNRWKVGDQFFGSIDRHMPRLQYLYVHNAVISLAAVQALNRLAHLRSVQLTYYADTDLLTKKYIKHQLLNNSVAKAVQFKLKSKK